MRKSPNRSRGGEYSNTSSRKNLNNSSNTASQKNLSNNLSRDLSRIDAYSQQELKQIRLEYKKYCNKVEIMTKKGFFDYFHLEDLDGTLVGERLYSCFAPTGSIDFAKFIKSISILSHGLLDEKIAFWFMLFDIKKNGIIEKSDMKKVLLSLLNAMIDIEVDREDVYYIQEDVKAMSVQEREEAIEAILDNFASVLTFEEFSNYMKNNPIFRQVLEST
ncbi:hypothetical protein SteCoe_22960 [Stentor coeruleus]|uniref:EF-hand domain-containing protein n=1 Tax=Stentor coeruleus TaxID=5963 RepID=A0A1R2BKW8_9CILI|nr:hypothetical protein SteCoe_22960 [Stentor coeruleus]